MKRILIAVCGALLLATFVVCDERASNETKRTANPSTVVAKEETSLPKDDIGKGLATSENPPPATAEVNMQGGKDKKYVGAESCKNCHRAKASGEQYNKWKEWKMAKAFDTLAGDKAKEIAKKQGVDDPQKSDKCLKCHVTAFDVADALLDKKFDKKQGVQCESCHGAGSEHVKNRMSAPDDEDDATKHANAQKEMPTPSKDVCLKCHNQEAFDITGEATLWDKDKKEFLLEKAMKEISHPNPKWQKK